jgi:hypothetical protein
VLLDRGRDDAAMLVVVWWKGEPPRWRWGGK